MKIKVLIILFFINLTILSFAEQIIILNGKRVRTDDVKHIVGYVGKSKSDKFWADVSRTLYRLCQDNDIGLIENSVGNPEKQKAYIKRMLENKDIDIEGILVGAISNNLSEVIQEARIKNIPVIAIEKNINSDIVSYVHTNYSESGEIMANYLLETLNNLAITGGRIIVIENENDINSQLVSENFKNLIESAGFDLVTIKTSDNEIKIKEALDKEISSQTIYDVVAAFSTFKKANSLMIESFTLEKQSIIKLGFGYDNITKRMLENKKLDAVICRQPKKIAQLSLDLLVKNINGEYIDSEYNITPILITRENILTNECDK
jgi:DNA-binding LacI/PurR family transcriptional regulator